MLLSVCEDMCCIIETKHSCFSDSELGTSCFLCQRWETSQADFVSVKSSNRHCSQICAFIYCHRRGEKIPVWHRPDFLVSSCVHGIWTDLSKCVRMNAAFTGFWEKYFWHERRITKSSDSEPSRLPKCSICGAQSTTSKLIRLIYCVFSLFILTFNS